MKMPRDTTGMNVKDIGRGYLLVIEIVKSVNGKRYAFYFMHKEDADQDMTLADFSRLTNIPTKIVRDRCRKVTCKVMPPSILWKPYSPRANAQGKLDARPLKVRVNSDYILCRKLDEKANRKRYEYLLEHVDDPSMNRTIRQLADEQGIPSATLWGRARNVVNGVSPPEVLLTGYSNSEYSPDWGEMLRGVKATRPATHGKPFSILGPADDF